MGQWAVVGEEGPELVRFDSPATVYSNDNSRSMAAKVAAQGEGRDTELVHLMKSELPILRSVLGPGKLNPRTGLWGFDFGLGGGDPSNDNGSAGNTGGSSAPDSGEGGLEGLEGLESYTQFDNIGTLTAKDFAGMLDKYGSMAALFQGREPGFRDHMTDIFSGLLGQIAQGLLSVLGGPIGKVASVALGYARSNATNGRARGTMMGGWIDNALSDRGVIGGLVSGRISASELAATAAGRVQNAFSDLSSRPGSTLSDPVGYAGDQAVYSAISRGDAGRSVSVAAMLGQPAGDLRSGLAGDFSSVIGTGQSVMASLPGFKNGGSFTVPGSGGPDSQTMAMRLTPGEKVRITPPGQDETAAQLSEVVRLLRSGLGLDAAGAETLSRLLASIDGRLAAIEGRSALAKAAA